MFYTIGLNNHQRLQREPSFPPSDKRYLSTDPLTHWCVPLTCETSLFIVIIVIVLDVRAVVCVSVAALCLFQWDCVGEGHGGLGTCLECRAKKVGRETAILKWFFLMEGGSMKRIAHAQAHAYPQGADRWIANPTQVQTGPYYSSQRP